MLKAIIFDWHGVLDFTTLEELIKVIALETSKQPEEIKKVIKQFKKQLITGRQDSAQVWEELSRLWGLNQDQLKRIEAYRLRIDKNDALFTLCHALQKKYRLAILSDCPTEKTQEIKKLIDLSIFDVVLFSSDLDLTKDDNAFFMECSQKLSLSPQEVLYVDDTLRHIEKAESLGFLTHHFTENESFTAFLKKALA